MREDVLGGKPLEADTSHPGRSPKDNVIRREGQEMLTTEEGVVLVKTARAAVETHLSGEEFQAPADASPGLKEERGVFVTLLDHVKGGSLRGCIVIPFPTRSLLEQARVAAVEAATTEFRFESVTLEELHKIRVLEATVLSVMEPNWVQNTIDVKEHKI